MCNNTVKYFRIFISLLVILTVLSGCKKFLDKKPGAGLDTPDNLLELQGLLDKYNTLNYNDPGPDEVSADDYYVTYTDWSSQTEYLRNQYTWEKENLFPNFCSEWNTPYTSAYYANTVLETINSISKTPANTTDWNNINGQALFWRAKNFFLIANIWAPAYDQSTAKTELGIPLRLSTNINEPSVRSSVEETYNRIIEDLKEAIPLLSKIPVHVVRPSKPAAAGLLARVYLSMRMYDSSYKYADLALSLKNDLMNYNTSAYINSSATFPFANFNPEMIMLSIVNPPSILINSRAKIDSLLYLSYNANDLRKTLFFKSNNNGTYGFKGSYVGSNALFTGISTDELFLIRAETNARLGNVQYAMNDLNTLLVTRWKTGAFQPFVAADKTTALNIILTERRKQLLMRCLRWMDIKRLNKEGYNIGLQRKLNDQVFTLQPNSLRFILPIPDDIILLTGITQNQR